MYNDELVKKFIDNYQEYRKMQGRLEKLRSKKPHPKNIAPMQSLLAGINQLRKEMDITAAQLELMAKRAKKGEAVDTSKLVN